jgi:hypothetical protein
MLERSADIDLRDPRNDAARRPLPQRTSACDERML